MQPIKLSGGGRFDTNVVGEQYYMDSLAKLCGAEEKIILSAVLVLDDKNKFDKNAVRVEIEGTLVGHLSRDMAKELRKYLKKINQPTASVTCSAKIKKSPVREATKQFYYDVYLDLPEPFTDSAPIIIG